MTIPQAKYRLHEKQIAIIMTSLYQRTYVYRIIYFMNIYSSSLVVPMSNIISLHAQIKEFSDHDKYDK